MHCVPFQNIKKMSGEKDSDCHLSTQDFPTLLQRRCRLLSLLTVVLFGFVWPLAYISAGGLYTEAERAAVIWPLGAGTFFPLTTANSTKKGENKQTKQNFPDDALPFTTSNSKQKKFWEISGNHNWHCYFQGLMAYIITMCFLHSPLFLWKVGWQLGCTVLYGSWIPSKHAFYLQPSAYRLRTLMHISPFTVCHCLVSLQGFDISFPWKRLKKFKLLQHKGLATANYSYTACVLWIHSIVNIIWAVGVKKRNK